MQERPVRERRDMSGFQDVFERIEVKYLLSRDQYLELRKRLEGYAEIDQYGLTSILNIYYDTEDYSLVRASLEKPVYKEKLRLRCYGTPEEDSLSFIEIKKKYKGVVYKRRTGMAYREAKNYLDGRSLTGPEGQIGSEIEFFRTHYRGLRPAMVISYDRIAMAGVEDPELRITFDTNIRWRTRDLDLPLGGQGQEIMDKGQVLMELKIAGSVPLELSALFSELHIYQTSFSKYGKGFEILCGEDPAILMPAPLPASACTAAPAKSRESRPGGLFRWPDALRPGRLILTGSHGQRAAQLR